MGKIERIYRERRRLLVCAFICSFFLFWVFCFPKPFQSIKKAFPWRYFHEPIFAVFAAAGVLAAFLLLILFVRYVLFRAATRKDPRLRQVVDDERIKMGWLRAFRVAFYVMVSVHLVYLFAQSRMYGWGLPHAAWFSSAMGLMAIFGAALYHTREVKDEKS